ncbi:MAG: methionine adenosyltransferase, partial [Muribaculaceae bacterium]|nr:methionine adenosyltransferase [Muribaculaceae bacterium]
VKSRTYIDLPEVVRRVINRIGYNDSEMKFDAESCGILSALHEQSADINQGVEREDAENQGAGDQGMMFGYACDETAEYMPLPLYLSHRIVSELAAIRHEGKEMTYLRPDAKTQVTIEYAPDNTPVRVHTIVVSTQHDDFIKPSSAKSQKEADDEMLAQIRNDVKTILIPRVIETLSEKERGLFDAGYTLHVNPTGKFVIGGPHGDTGLTGRKIIVDTYGGRGAHGGGAFSGKDPSKVDRSAAYAARHIAKNIVAAGIAREALVQVAYAIGVAEPVSLYVNTFGKSLVNKNDAEISEIIKGVFKMTPCEIERRLNLRQPIYEETAAYGHMGRQPKTVKKVFTSRYEKDVCLDVDLFTWERLDYVDILREKFGITR